MGIATHRDLAIDVYQTQPTCDEARNIPQMPELPLDAIVARLNIERFCEMFSSGYCNVQRYERSEA
jgi:hypothetical protein